MEFTPQSIKRLFYLILLTSIAFLASRYLSTNPQNHWLIWASLVLSLITLGDTFLQRVTIIFATGLATAIVVFLAGLSASSLLILAAYLFIITICSFFIAERYANYFLLAFIVNLFAIVAGEKVIPLTLNADRALYILAGALIAGCLQIIFIIGFTRNKLHAWLIIALRSLASLTDEIFSCFLHPEYPKNIYLFERRVHVQKRKFMLSIERLHDIARSAESKMHLGDKQVLQHTQKKLNHLFDVIIDCAQLRRRVTDHTIFQVCTDELTAISKEIDKLFSDMIRNKKPELDTTELANKIKRFEETYANVLQVTSREPLVFLLFITSLNALREAMESFYASLRGLKKI